MAELIQIRSDIANAKACQQALRKIFRGEHEA
jgi:hypothetical protein